MQRWKLDTCKCVILEDVIDGVPVYNSHESICSFHNTLTPTELATVPRDDNRKKNEIYGEILKSAPVKALKTDLDGNKYVDWTWSFEGSGKDRIVNFIVNNLTTKELNDLKIIVNSVTGKVKIA